MTSRHSVPREQGTCHGEKLAMHNLRYAQDLPTFLLENSTFNKWLTFAIDLSKTKRTTTLRLSCLGMSILHCTRWTYLKQMTGKPSRTLPLFVFFLLPTFSQAYTSQTIYEPPRAPVKKVFVRHSKFMASIIFFHEPPFINRFFLLFLSNRNFDSHMEIFWTSLKNTYPSDPYFVSHL